MTAGLLGCEDDPTSNVIMSEIVVAVGRQEKTVEFHSGAPVGRKTGVPVVGGDVRYLRRGRGPDTSSTLP